MAFVDKIGLGTVQFGLQYGISNDYGQTSSWEVEEILKYGQSCGLNTIDTASAYGTSEQVLGSNNLSGFNIVSKFLIKEDGRTLSDQLFKSLELLNLRSLYGYMAHRAIDVIKFPELWRELKEYKNQGIIRKIGFSFNEIEEVDLVLSKGLIPDIVQVPYNYLDSRFKNYMIELKDKGCEIHTRSAFLQGLFFANIDSLGTFFDELKPTLRKLQENESDLPGKLLGYCVEKKFIDKVIVGVNNISQLKKNISGIEKMSDLPPLKSKIKESLLIPSKWQV